MLLNEIVCDKRTCYIEKTHSPLKKEIISFLTIKITIDGYVLSFHPLNCGKG